MEKLKDLECYAEDDNILFEFMMIKKKNKNRLV
jgi:hypothetical protein